MKSIPKQIRRIVLMLIFITIYLQGCKFIDLKKVNTESSKNEVSLHESKNKEDLSLTELPKNPSDSSIEQTEDVLAEEPYLILKEDGSSLAERIQPPKGYQREAAKEGELATFLRNHPLKNHNSPLLLYDGSQKRNQEDHYAIFDLSLKEQDLQQCADSIIRIYSEYYWSQGMMDKIGFHLTNGFYMDYLTWRDGNRIKVEGNKISWVKSKEYDDSYETFLQYLNMVFSYAGTLSLSTEVSPISFESMMIGDMFLQGGSPGHCVLVADIAINTDGKKSFLLAQGYMPAQEFHIVRNPLHPENPWYYEDEFTYPLFTPSWTFKEGSLVRWAEFPMNESTLTSSQSSIPAIAVSNKNNTHTTPSSSNSSELTLLAVGDNLIHIEVVKSGEKVDGSYNFDHLYANLKDDISAADIAILNQETILGTDEIRYSGYPNFYSPEAIGEAAIAAGFDVILHATNHTFDHGMEGLNNTFEFWSKHPEIMVLGINESKEKRKQIPIYEKNGIKIAMLNYTYGLNGYTLPSDKPYLVNGLKKEEMQKDILKAKELADFVIVFPHWGNEYVYEPTSAQRSLVDFYYDLGVNLVIGTHPHVLEPVQWVKKNEDHSMLVYYSLGNFISYQREAPRMLGGIAKVTIQKDSSGTFIKESSITPIVTHYEHGSLDYNYGIHKLTDYSDYLASLHGVSKLASQGAFTYDDTVALAKKVLGEWYQTP